MNLTDEEKKIIDDDATIKQIHITFPNHEIDNIENDRIYQEAMTLEDSILDSNTFELGKCNSALFTIKVADFTEDIENAKMNVSLTFTNEELGNVEIQIGKYIVSSVERTSDRRWKTITASDYMTLFDVDIADWFNNVLFPTADTTRTVNEILVMLCDYIGVVSTLTETLTHDGEVLTDENNKEIVYSYGNNILIFGNLIISKNIEPTSLVGRDFLQQLCAFNVRYGHFNEDGILDFVTLDNENITEIDKYKSCDYEDYYVKPIDAIQIRMEDGDIGLTTDEGGIAENIYTITGNSFLYGLSTEELRTIANIILEKVKNITYRPNTSIVQGMIYLPLGAKYQINTTNDVITSYLLKRSVSGIQALFTSLIANGSENATTEESSITTEITILKGKSAVFKKDIDGLSAEFTNYSNNTNAKIEANAEGLSAEISRVNTITENLTSDIESNATAIADEVARATEQEETLSNSIQVNAEGLTAEIKRATESEGELSTTINATAEGLSAEIKRATDGEGELNTKIEATAENIKTEISKTYATSSALTDTEKTLTGQISDVDSKVDDLADSTQESIDNLQGQIDGAITTFTGSETPTLDNYPANEWADDKTKNTHIGDLYYVEAEGDTQGYCYRFQLTNSGYEWVLLKDSEITKAVQEASEAMNKATSVAQDLSDNYSTTEEMESAIDESGEEATSKAIADTVERLKSYSTTEEVKSAIEESSDSIKQSVSATYTTKLEFDSLNVGTSNKINGSEFLNLATAYELLRYNGDTLTYNGDNIYIAI